MKDIILLIGNDTDYVNSLELELTNAEYDVIISNSFYTIENLLREEDIKLIIIEDQFLDKTFYLRKSGYNKPIVTIYKKYNKDTLLEALNNGIDDCIPFLYNMQLLIAKVKNLIKRYYRNFDVIKYKDITFHSHDNDFYIKDNFLELTKLEKQLLLEFLKNSNKTLSRDFLLETVWAENFEVQLTTVNVAVKRLRDKINSYMGDTYIKSIRGQGYLFS